MTGSNRKDQSTRRRSRLRPKAQARLKILKSRAAFVLDAWQDVFDKHVSAFGDLTDAFLADDPRTLKGHASDVVRFSTRWWSDTIVWFHEAYKGCLGKFPLDPSSPSKR